MNIPDENIWLVEHTLNKHVEKLTEDAQESGWSTVASNQWRQCNEMLVSINSHKRLLEQATLIEEWHNAQDT